MKSKILSCLPAIFCFLAGGATSAFAQGTAFTYQGRLTDGTNAATGNYDMRFYLRDAFSGGNPIGNTNTLAPVGVSNGQFAVTLDFGAGIFTGPARWLEIAVRTNGGAAAFATLAPRQALTATPYAILAGNAGNLGGQPPASYAAVTSLFNYVVKAGDTMAGNLSILNPGILGFGAQTRQMIDLWNNNGADYGIGVQTKTFYQRSGGGGGGFAWYSGGVHSDAQNDAGANGSTLMTLDSSGNLVATGSVIANSTTTDGSGTAVIGYGSRFGVIGTASRGVLGQSYNNDGVEGVSSIGNGVHGESTSGWGIYGHSGNNAGVLGLSVSGAGVDGESTSGWGVFGRSLGSHGVFGQTLTNAQSGVLGRNDGPTGVGGQAVFGYASTGAIGVNGISEAGDGVVGETHGASKRGVVGLSTQGDALYGSGKNGVHGESGSGTDSGVWGNNTGGGYGVVGTSDATNGTGVYGRGALWAGYFAGRVSVCTLEIRGGCDVAEPFRMSQQEIAKGSVVIIDDQNAGQLKLSDRAYDTRVAGIVSGANGINPGIALHQDGTFEGGQNVALSGRVYVLADASSGSIKPGDLLTSSATPGHAMKASNHAKAQGAIIGKAMNSLEAGKGLVLVLVTLQ